MTRPDPTNVSDLADENGVIRFSIADAADALARSDEGADLLPGDKALIDAYEGYCQQEWDRHTYACYEADRAVWLAKQCPGCEPGGGGEECDDHYQPPTCVRCQTRPSDGACCTAHGCELCHGCYRHTHFVEVCVSGCGACAFEGLDPAQAVAR